MVIGGKNEKIKGKSYASFVGFRVRYDAFRSVQNRDPDGQS